VEGGEQVLTRGELEKLAGVPEGEKFYLSLYLTVDPATNPNQEYLRLAKNLVKQEIGRWEESGELSKGELRELSEGCENLLQYLVLNQGSFRKGLVVFSDPQKEFWKEYHLAVAVPPRFVIDKRPYLKPLVRLFDDYEPFLIVLVDRRRARLFLVQLGEVLVYVEESHPEIPGKHKKGGWRAWEQSKFSRQIEKMVTFHLEEVAEMLEDFLKNQEINRVAVGGPVEAVSQFKELLPAWVQEKVSAYLSTEMTTAEKDLVEQALKVLEQVEREQEDRLVEELLNRVAKGDRAAIGVDDVLAKVEQGQVHKLVVAAEFERPGYRCPNCGSLFAQQRDTCFCCGHYLEEIPNLIDHIVKEAVNQGARIEVVKRDHSRLMEAGGIGALLRF